MSRITGQTAQIVAIVWFPDGIPMTLQGKINLINFYDNITFGFDNFHNKLTLIEVNTYDNIYNCIA